MGDVVDECPSDASTGTRVDEAVLRTGIEGIFAIDELRMEHNVTLLRLGLQVWQTIPGLQVLRAGDGSGSSSSREISRLRVVVTLGTEHAIDPAVLVLRDTHVIDICGRNHIVGHRDRLVPETEVVDTVGRLGHSEETLAVGTLHTNDKHILAVPLDST